jgi:uncharacterized protein (TIGR02118 family)
MVIKRITAANENLTSGRSRVEAQQYWAESHGKLVANSASIMRYHHYFSLPEAYENDPKPSYIGISMFWRSDVEQMFAQSALAPRPPVLSFAGGAPAGASDDRQLFDREARWPIDDQHADIFGEENVIIDGAKTPTMVNAIFMVCRKPGLDHRDFFQHWSDVQVRLASKLPGLRRYIQAPAALASFNRGSQTHDGWSEFWFDDYAAFQRAYRSPEWAAMEEDGRTLFMPEKHIVIGHEYVQKDDNWKPRDYGALDLNDDQIRERLKRDGYASLAADPSAPGTIKAAVAAGKLAVWTPHHLVTQDESNIDARPEAVPTS